MISEAFKKAISDKDFDRARIMMKNTLTMDLTFKSFQEMLDYALKYHPEIIERHDGGEFAPQEDWDKLYSSLIKVDLLDNFSAERIEHIKNVHTYIYSDEIDSSEYNSIDEKDSGTTPNSRNMIVLITTIGVAAASIIFGVIRDMSIVTIATGTVIATCIIGGVTYYLVKKIEDSK